jgi:hypothetical protein
LALTLTLVSIALSPSIGGLPGMAV